MNRTRHNTGSVLPLVAVSLVLFLLMLAFVVDIGWIYLAKSDLKNAADSAAMAGASQLIKPYTQFPGGEPISNPSLSQKINAARDASVYWANQNHAGSVSSLALDANMANAADGDVVLGFVSNPFVYDATFEVGLVNINAIKVKTQLSTLQNNPLALFLGGITKVATAELSAESTVVVSNNIKGFYPPADIDGETPLDPPSDNQDEKDDKDTPPPVKPNDSALFISPFAVKLSDWNKSENWSGNAQGQGNFNLHSAITDSSGNSIPGNFGTLDFYNSNGTIGASVLENILLNGIDAKTVQDLGGILIKETIGAIEGWIDAKPGEYTSLKNAFNTIQGQTRFIILYDEVIGSGSTAKFRIGGIAAVAIGSSNLTGKPDERYIQVSMAEDTYTTWAMISTGTDPTNIFNSIIIR